MNSILTGLAIGVISGWAVGHFRYHEGGFFHLILIVGLIAIIRQLLPIRKENKKANGSRDQISRESSEVHH